MVVYEVATGRSTYETNANLARVIKTTVEVPTSWLSTTKHFGASDKTGHAIIYLFKYEP